MKLNPTKSAELFDVLEAIGTASNLDSEIEKQQKLVASMSESSFSSGERGDALFYLARLYFQKQSFQQAKNCAVEAVGLRRLFYGKKAKEFLDAVTLARLINDEIEKTEPPKRRRRGRVKSPSI